MMGSKKQDGQEEGRPKRTKKLNRKLLALIEKRKRKELAWGMSENLTNRSSGMDQSKTSRFSWSRAALELFGRTLWPIWSPQRRAT